jgi:hypothetical protein
MRRLGNASVLPFEASPPAPLHFVERGGPAIGVSDLGKAGSNSFPLSTKWRGGQGVRLRRAGRPEATPLPEGFS